MKFIGQYIQQLTARFRKDVYLENVNTGTITSGGNLGLDANNKIVKATVSGGGSGDIEGVTAGTGLSGGGTSGTVTLNVSGITVSEFNSDVIQTGDESFSDDDTSLMTSAAIDDQIQQRLSAFPNVTLAGSLDYITISGQEITRNAIDLAADVTGTLPAGNGGTGLTSISTLLNSNTTKSDVGLGNVENKSSATIRGEIVSGDIPNNAADTSGNAATATALATARNIAGVSFDGTGDISLNNNAITNGAGYTTNTGDIDQVALSDSSGNVASYASGNANYTFANGEGITVTVSNAAKSITIAAEKAYVHYRFMGYGSGDGTNYFSAAPFTDAQSPMEHNDSSSSDGLTIPAGSGTNVSELIRSGGHVMTRDGTLKKWTGGATYNQTNGSGFIGLFRWTPADNDNTNITPVLLDTVTITGKGNDKVRTFAETSFTQASVSAGDIIFTQIKTDTNNKTIYFNSTLEVEF